MMKKSSWIWSVLLGIIIGVILWPIITTNHGSSSSHARQTAFNLKNAIDSYVSEYRKLPGFASSRPYDIDLQSDEKFMAYLLDPPRGRRMGLNKRGILFFTAQTAKKNEAGRYRTGISTRKGVGSALWDPWGNHYRIRIDSNNDGRVIDPQTNGPMKEIVLIWTAGKDGDFGTWEDNQKTW